MDKLSIIVPCYNEEPVLSIFYDELKQYRNTFKEAQWEIIFINDGSKDNTINEIIKLSNKDNEVKYINFSRNFGKEAAMFAGLEAATGNFIVIMDADLQDPPKLLYEMYQTIKETNYDSVATRRVSRKGEPPIRSFFARCFYRLINKISKVDIVDGARDFRMMNRKMVDALLELKEYNRFSKGLFGWVGFETKWLEYENVERAAGETKWSFWKLFLYSLEGIIAFSTVPLAISSVVGIIFCILAFIMTAFIVLRALIWGDPVSGWPSLASIIMFIGGVQLFSIGILGQYLAKTYMEVKNRPIYIIKNSKL